MEDRRLRSRQCSRPWCLVATRSVSVRIPAAYCGLWGIKPTRGLIGRSGISHLSWALDTIGTIAACAPDLALALSAFGGPDVGDRASLEVKLISRALPVLAALSSVDALLMPMVAHPALLHDAPLPAGQADLTLLVSAAGANAVVFQIPADGRLPLSAH